MLCKKYFFVARTCQNVICTRSAFIRDTSNILHAKRTITTKFVPMNPTWISNTSNSSTELSDKQLRLLEQLSLLEYKDHNDECKNLAYAVSFATFLHNANTEHIKPMVSSLEDMELLLREDVVTEGGDAKPILSNAKLVFEDYFVAPPGNIPLPDNRESA